MKLHYASSHADWDAIPSKDRNVWQRLAARTHGTLTLGNGVSVFGLILVMYGLVVMSSGRFWSGLGLVVTGRIADILDGTVADRTGTKGPVGEVMDATFDKVAAIVVLICFVYHDWLPVIPVVCVALQVIMSSTLALSARVWRVKLHVNADGKIATVFAWAILFLFAIATTVEHSGSHALYLACASTGYALAVVFLALTARATMGYVRAIGYALAPLEYSAGVTAIDFADWHEKHGIRAVLFDIDGTLAPWNDAHVDDGIKAALRQARKAGITHIGLVSNMSRRRSERLIAVAKQVEANTYHVPNNWREHKPSPAMIRTALKKIDAHPEETGFVGDKLVDVLAARRAGLARVAWVDRLGTADHLVDRVFYRPFERLLKRAIR